MSPEDSDKGLPSVPKKMRLLLSGGEQFYADFAAI
jgi:hypothetical protein